MTPPPVPGFASAERFACTLPFGRFVRRFIPMIVTICLLFMLIVMMLVRLPWPFAAVLGLGLAAVLTLHNKKRFDREWGTSALELSPEGVTLVRSRSRTHLPWDRIREIGKADLVEPRYTSVGGNLVVTLFYVLIVSTTRRRAQPALIGPALSRPELDRSAVRPELREDIDPGRPRPQAAIVLPIYEKDWETGRIGAWIRAYRADLLAGR